MIGNEIVVWGICCTAKHCVLAIVPSSMLRLHMTCGHLHIQARSLCGQSVVVFCGADVALVLLLLQEVFIVMHSSWMKTKPVKKREVNLVMFCGADVATFGFVSSGMLHLHGCGAYHTDIRGCPVLGQ